ncbi:MAG: thiamine pyrophosphate-requiring protein, partial [Candidatus Dormibacteraeota bacterium]|nr:thiamine pyrophosphate-requiring protein [Candidatus Dormibacteraeota bacterium]
MRVVDAIATILKREGIEFLFCYPTTPLIDAVAEVGIRPIVCRQERVGVGIADGFTRMTAGRTPGVFAMQFGPGVENAIAGIATAFSDSVPLVLLPLGHPVTRAQVFPLFNSVRSLASLTKSVESIVAPDQTIDVMRRAFAAVRGGRPGPAAVEIPIDLASQSLTIDLADYRPVKGVRSQGDPLAVDRAVHALIKASSPVIYAGQGVLYSDGCSELLELAEQLDVPVMTSLEGKGAFPETHPLSLGTGGPVMTGPIAHFLPRADLVLGIGCSFTRHIMSTLMPQRTTLIQATNDPRDLNKSYWVEHPILGDAKLVLQQFLDCIRDRRDTQKADIASRRGAARRIEEVRSVWLQQWHQKLSSAETPITPYRVIADFMVATDPDKTVVTHDSGSPRDQLVPFYRTTKPHGYIGWGKSHALGTGLGLIMGAKLAEPTKFCVNFMGDAAFGMTGMDMETAVRERIPILTVVLKNSTMAIETETLVRSHELYGTRSVGGDYAGVARALGCWAD